MRKEGQQAMNRDEGNYQLSFLDTVAVHCVKIQKNWVPAFFWWRPLREVKMLKVFIFMLVLLNKVF